MRQKKALLTSHLKATIRIQIYYIWLRKIRQEKMKKDVDKITIRAIILINKWICVEMCIVIIGRKARWKIIMYIQHI